MSQDPSPRMMRIAFLFAIAACILVGLGGGVGLFTFGYARGASYMTDDPRACANCHVMNEQYDGWLKGSHHAVAVCNDCHTPHGFVSKYYTKALNGYHHSLAFTTGNFHEPIQITERNWRIAEQACRDCHSEIVQALDTTHRFKPGEDMSCTRCHADVGH